MEFLSNFFLYGLYSSIAGLIIIDLSFLLFKPHPNLKLLALKVLSALAIVNGFISLAVLNIIL